MDLAKWKVEFKPGWDIHFANLDKSIRLQIMKKFDQMEQPLRARGLHSSSYKVEEVGQYRIAFIENEEKRTKFIHFVGDHKQYDKWTQSHK